MSAGWLIAIILGIGAVAYFFAAQRARVQAEGSTRSGKDVPHSLPTYHGWLAFIIFAIQNRPQEVERVLQLAR